ncbi:energy transducer TonB [Sphingomonas sp. OK281]|uniref:energy transducer TonB n=1 Tax=Sphingomonas sp. OK281 TaxID=1881067 RepID=UPI0015877309|nr:energy transducer TonB [Sphingomonas sp. OK281]
MLVSGTAYGGGQATAPVPIDPASWLSYDDYPVSAVKVGQHGTVSYRVFVGDDGGVISCIVTKSSGVPALDNQSCASIMQRARFIPAKDRAGRVRSGAYDGKVTWTVPQDASAGMPTTSMRIVFSATLDREGALVNCRMTFGSQDQPPPMEICRSMRETATRVGVAHRPDSPDGVFLVSESTTEFTGKPIAGVAPQPLTEIGRRTVRFHVDETGRATDCREERSGELFSTARSPCAEAPRYRTFDGSPVATDGVVTDRSGWRRRPSPDGV